MKHDIKHLEKNDWRSGMLCVHPVQTKVVFNYNSFHRPLHVDVVVEVTTNCKAIFCCEYKVRGERRHEQHIASFKRKTSPFHPNGWIVEYVTSTNTISFLDTNAPEFLSGDDLDAGGHTRSIHVRQ